MIAFILSAALLQTATSTVSPAPAASSGPLREVVYKYSYNDKTEMSTSASIGDQLAAPPTSAGFEGGYNGTMTVDVLQVDPSDGYIKAEVHCETDAANGKKPDDAVFVVHPDGGLTIVSGNYDTDMLTLLPYFGTQYYGPHDPLQQGMQWTDATTFQDGKTEIPAETVTTVTSVTGSSAQIQATTKATNVGTGFGIELKVLYNAQKLVPLNLDVRTMVRGESVNSTGERILHYHFDRVSDTLDKS